MTTGDAARLEGEREQEHYARLADRAEAEDYCPIEALPPFSATCVDLDAFLAAALQED